MRYFLNFLRVVCANYYVLNILFDNKTFAVNMFDFLFIDVQRCKIDCYIDDAWFLLLILG